MSEPTLYKVVLRADIYHLLLAHALSTEKEEIMGMLLGDWIDLSDGIRSVAHVESISILTRSDKRKDRVEIAPEQLHLAAIHAEQIEKRIGKRTRVIGWYHSHPHITVFPSHVDLRTQFAQQMMDSRFFGLIVSCFNTDAEQLHKIQITCFQARNESVYGVGPLIHVETPLVILPSSPLTPDSVETLCELPLKVYEEQRREYRASLGRITYGGGFESDVIKDEAWMDVDGDPMESSSRRRHLGPSSSSPSLPDAMTRLHNTSVYARSITDLVDNLVGPAAQIMSMRHGWNLAQIEHLQRRKAELESRRRQTGMLIEL